MNRLLRSKAQKSLVKTYDYHYRTSGAVLEVRAMTLARESRARAPMWLGENLKVLELPVREEEQGLECPS